MTELEKRLDWTFKDKELLARALRTPSVRMVHPEALDNQRLEFLGDAVFGLIAAEEVYRQHPDDQEGALTVRRTHAVSGASLARVAERLELRQWVQRNEGAHPLPPNAKVLADAMEAVMGAVWLDGGLDAARHVFKRLQLPMSEEIDEWGENPKGCLLTRAQAMHPPRKPVYEVLSITGASHAPVVTMRVTVPGWGTAEATAISKTAAEVAVAAALLKQCPMPPKPGEKRKPTEKYQNKIKKRRVKRNVKNENS